MFCTKSCSMEAGSLRHVEKGEVPHSLLRISPGLASVVVLLEGDILVALRICRQSLFKVNFRNPTVSLSLEGKKTLFGLHFLDLKTLDFCINQFPNTVLFIGCFHMIWSLEGSIGSAFPFQGRTRESLGGYLIRIFSVPQL